MFIINPITIISAVEDDSDMWMEPDELPPPEFSVVRSESRVVREYSPPIIQTHQAGFLPIPNPIPSNFHTISRAEQSEPIAPEAAAQNFFPSYFRNSPQNSGNSRPFTSSPNSASAIAGRYSAAGGRTAFDQSILGN